MEAKKNILTYEGLRKLEDELEHPKVVKRKEISQKIKEAREQGDLSGDSGLGTGEVWFSCNTPEYCKDEAKMRDYRTSEL